MSVIHILFGRLSFASLPFWQMLQHPTVENLVNGSIACLAAFIFLFGAAVTVFLITWFGKWKVLWSKWLTSVDHKRIGIMYIVVAFVMLARALIEAALMRTQQAFGLGGGFLSPDHFAELFSTHGTIMIFFMAMPFLIGIINYVMPLQIGARDVSFPVMNSVSLGLTVAGAMLVMISLVLGEFYTGGWSGYPPYTEAAFNPGVGPDYWIWALSLSSIGSMLTGINFAVTIYKKRAPGMRFMRMPLFTWTALCTSILMIFAMPPLTVATALLALDRYLGFHFFTNGFGGNLMEYVNLFWLFGHPEVYIVILPAFGIYSEVFSTFSGKALYGYVSLVLATMAIASLSFTVWLHHFFTMGQGASVNAVFGIATMLIGIPTGVKVYDWLLTMFRGRVRFRAPLVYSLAFAMLFVIGGMTGILLANPSIDYQVHNTQFLVAHFHNVLVPGTLFGMLAAYHFWFPKAFGFRLDERWGMISAFCWIVGFILAFFPLYGLGLLGYPRRHVAFFDPVFLPYMIVALIGAAVVLLALLSLLMQLLISVRRRGEYAVPAGDPWDGRSLEWSIPAPPPEYNCSVLPKVICRDEFSHAKEAGTAYQVPPQFNDIRMPKNSAMGIIICVSGGLIGFGLVWYIWWLVVAASLIVLGAVIGRGFVREVERGHPCARGRRGPLALAPGCGRDSPDLAHRRSCAGQSRPCRLCRARGGRVSALPLRHPGINLGAAHPDTHEKSEELLFGFWVFLMSDAIVFGLLFANYAAMVHATAGGPGTHKLYDIRSAFGETVMLLSSSFTYGMASLSLKHRTRRGPLFIWLGVTLCLAAIFLGLEIHDCFSMLAKGGGPTRSAFLSSFFALVPLHGLHVTCGCIWMIAIVGQIKVYGIDAEVKLGLLRLGLFWHFLDIVWIAIFSLVYLGGLA